MKITGDWINSPQTQSVCQMLINAGYQAYFVGGCVRNELLGLPVNDLDICTDAHPQTVMDLAKSAGLGAIPTGIDHGTVTVVSQGIAHEITTFRKDVTTDGRHATVEFSDTITDDAQRRDFTMNALYADANGNVTDPVNGLPDLKRRHFRFIGDAADRIREDYLRILRFFRFTATYGDPALGFDHETLAAIADHVDGLDGLSRERIGAEVMKLLAAPDPAPAIATMCQTGVLSRILPAADDRYLAPLIHLEQRDQLAPMAIRRLAILSADAAQARTALRLSNAQSNALQICRDEMGTLRAAHALAYDYGASLARDILYLRAALFETQPMPQDIADIELAKDAVFPVTAADLMPDFQGPDLGRRLRQLTHDWVASKFTLTRDELCAKGPEHDD